MIRETKGLQFVYVIPVITMGERLRGAVPCKQTSYFCSVHFVSGSLPSRRVLPASGDPSGAPVLNLCTVPRPQKASGITRYHELVMHPRMDNSPDHTTSVWTALRVRELTTLRLTPYVWTKQALTTLQLPYYVESKPEENRVFRGYASEGGRERSGKASPYRTEVQFDSFPDT